MVYQNKIFSHIYLEKQAADYVTTQQILNQFKKSKIILIENYKEIINRRRQNFRLQKLSQKLIIAKRTDEFIYKGSSVVPNFGYQYFYYNTLALNCLYDCEYCYLQGMFPSAHLTVFVNNEDFIAETINEVIDKPSAYLCLSYDTDLLALENILGYCKEWINFSRNVEHLTIEIRTKSAAINSLKSVQPHDRTILAWTISPQKIVDKYESGTASTKARIKSLKTAIDLGFKVRLCIDPIIPLGNWQNNYSELINEIFSELDPKKINDASIGSFRIGSQYYKQLKKVQTSSKLVQLATPTSSGLYAFTSELENESINFVKDKLLEWLDNDKIDTVCVNSDKNTEQFYENI